MLSMRPYRSLLDEMMRLCEETLREAQGRSSLYPAINLYDDGETFLIRAEVPGLDRDKLEITAKGDRLTLRGERRVVEAQAEACYHRRERSGGTFRRVLTLSDPLDTDGIQATYNQGVLEVRAPRAASARPRTIGLS